MDLAFSRDGGTLYSGGGDGTLRRWDWRSLPARRGAPAGHRRDPQPGPLARRPDAGLLRHHPGQSHGKQPDTVPRPGDRRGGRPARRVRLGVAWSLAYSPDGRTLAEARARTPEVLLWDAAGRRVRARLAGHGDDAIGVCYSPDGRRLATGGHGPDGPRLGRRERPGARPAIVRGLGHRPRVLPRRPDGGVLRRWRHHALGRRGGSGHADRLDAHGLGPLPGVPARRATCWPPGRPTAWSGSGTSGPAARSRHRLASARSAGPDASGCWTSPPDRRWPRGLARWPIDRRGGIRRLDPGLGRPDGSGRG